MQFVHQYQLVFCEIYIMMKRNHFYFFLKAVLK